MRLTEKINELNAPGEYTSAWNSHKGTMLEMIESTGAKSVVEIGGGRFPYLTQEEIERLGIDYTSNDISARELSLGPNWVSKAHFDVQTADRAEVKPYANSYDFAFSKMVMEHVASYERAYRNIHEILKPGGVTFAFHPVLYTVPFVVNRFMPEKLSARVLTSLFPHRTDDGIPKFPATYSGCRVSRGVRRKLEEIGFSQVWQVPFYGHNYYNRLPVLRDVHKAATEWLRRHNVEALASYAYTIAVK